MVNQKSRSVAWILAIFSLMWVLAACSSQANLAYAEVAPASIELGSAIPNPSNEVILKVTGEIENTNSGEALSFDMATLERLGLVEYTIADPWQNHEEVSYTGVLLSDLLEYAGITETATNIHIVALDDYAVDVSLEDIQKWPVMLATRTDGKYMSVENSGPTRIIFPFHSNPEIDEDIYKVLMIWNLRDVEVQ